MTQMEGQYPRRFHFEVKRTLFFLGITLVVIPLADVVFFLPRKHAVLQDLSSAKGRTATGWIAGKGTEHNSTYYADLSFVDEGGRQHNMRNWFGQEQWTVLSAGQLISVRYLAADPESAFAEGSLGLQQLDPFEEYSVSAGLELLGTALIFIAWKANPFKLKR